MSYTPVRFMMCRFGETYTSFISSSCKAGILLGLKLN